MKQSTREIILLIMAFLVMTLGTAYLYNDMVNHGGVKALVEKIWYGR